MGIGNFAPECLRFLKRISLPLMGIGNLPNYGVLTRICTGSLPLMGIGNDGRAS